MLLYILNGLLSVVIIFLFFIKVLDKKLISKYLPYYFAAFVVFNNFIYLIRSTAVVIAYIFLYILSIVFIRLCFHNIKIKSIIYICSLLYLLNYTISFSLIVFNLKWRSNLILIEFLINLLIFIVCLIVYSTKTVVLLKTIVTSISPTVKTCIILLFILCMLNVALLSDIEYYILTDDLLIIAKIISISSVLLICLAFPAILLISMSNTHLKNLTKNYEEQIEAQALHYSELSRSNLEVRKFRHDLKNIKIGVGKLINEGRYNEALTMLELADDSKSSLLAFDTGNSIVDALLADKQKKAAPTNIKIDFEGAVPEENIPATELCVLFGNTIDNAIEACRSLDNNADKVIKVECKCNSGFMFINMSNPVDKPIAIKNNTIKTTKADQSLHGFGLYSLDKVVKKHNGEMKLSCDDNVFNLDLSLCLK